ncbi:MAG: hypothetical protein H8E27_12695 [Verrucomicrobia subdivision 3 bacterium]|nr:hypothetical protein [Limisphaerales bacterium]
MKLLGKMLVCAVLVGCSQESLELAQQDISPAPKPPLASQPEETILPEPPPKVAKPVVAEPSKIQLLPAPVETPKVVPPKAEPTPPKTEPAPEPAKPKLTPEEIKARKLISDDPEENLEVLNQALDAWLTTHEELPEKIADLVMGDHLPMLPMAPVGQRFEIDRVTNRVVLVAKK